MDDLISVIVPVYNKEKYIRKCLDSLLAQTYDNLEIILVDDGSTDLSSDICDEYAKKEDRIKVIHQENAGSSAARNRGIDCAQGAFIGFADADDFTEPDMYKILYEALKEHPDYEVAQLMSRCVDESGKEVQAPLKNSGNTIILRQRDYFKELLLHRGDSSFCTKLFRRKIVKAHRFMLNRLNEDFELLLRMMPEISGIVTVEQVGYNIVLSTQSVTRGKYNQKLYEDMMQHVEDARKLVDRSFPDFQEEMKKFELTQSLDFLLHIPTACMTRDNELLQKTVKLVKNSKEEIKTNSYFDEKQRKNLKILSAFPVKFVRQVHGMLMKIRHNEE